MTVPPWLKAVVRLVELVGAVAEESAVRLGVVADARVVALPVTIGSGTTVEEALMVPATLTLSVLLLPMVIAPALLPEAVMEAVLPTLMAEPLMLIAPADTASMLTTGTELTVGEVAITGAISTVGITVVCGARVDVVLTTVALLVTVVDWGAETGSGAAVLGTVVVIAATDIGSAV